LGIANSNISIGFTAHFSFGSGSTCPHNEGFNYFQSNDTLTVNTYYDTRGGWPVGFGESKDSVAFFSSLAGINFIHVRTNEILYKTATLPDTAFNDVDTTFILRPTAITEFGWANTVTIFPNPARDFINIEAGAELSSIEVINELGWVIRKHIPAGLKAQISLLDLPKGVYQLKIALKDSRMYNRAFVHQ
jgi:hypothetical protein